VHVHKDPPMLGTLPTALEGSFGVFISALASQGKADPTEDGLGVMGQESNSTRKGWYPEEFSASTHIALRSY
jgi:hypothetical protein